MNKTLQIAAASLALGALAGTVMAGTDAVKQPSIPFADQGGIRNWEADKDVGVWVQDIHRKWYYARFMSPCHELRFVEGVAFITGPGGTLDKFSSLKVRGGERCVFTSFEDSKGPPPGKKGAKPAPVVTKEPAAPAAAAPAKPSG